MSPCLSGSRPPENRPNTRQFFVDHITTVCKHFAGQLQSWDVVNKAILPKDGQPGGMRKSFWYDQIGPDYINLAFRTARAADPHAKLTYNDYGVEYDNDDSAERRRLILELLRGMQKRGVPLDVVGIQSHVKAAQPDKFGQGLADYIEAIRQMGLEVYLTEMDVNEDDIATDDPVKRDAIIAQTYTEYLRVALANPAVKLVLTWDLSDRFTWLNNGPTHYRKQPNRPQRSLPFDRDYRLPKTHFSRFGTASTVGRRNKRGFRPRTA
jgi:endo-1,4-beta-xylanase